jgi:hypothetical protein
VLMIEGVLFVVVFLLAVIVMSLIVALLATL